MKSIVAISSILLGSVNTQAEQVLLHQKIRNLDIVPDLTMISSEYFLKASLEASSMTNPNCEKEIGNIFDQKDIDIANTKQCAVKEKSAAPDDMIFTMDFSTCAISTFKYQSACTAAGGKPGSLPSYNIECKVMDHDEVAKITAQGLEVPYCIGQSCDAVTKHDNLVITEVEKELTSFVEERLRSEGMELACAIGDNSPENEPESQPKNTPESHTASPASVVALDAIPLMGGLLFLLAHVLE